MLTRLGEAVAHVLAGEQRQRAELDDRLAGGVRVQRAHAGQPAVEGDEQVEALLLPDLADDDPVRAHAQRLLDQAPQLELTRALEIGLPGLHRHDVRQADLHLEDLLAGDHPLAARDGPCQRVEQRGLPRLRPARHDHVEPGHDRRLEEPPRLVGQRPEPDELVQRARGEHELPDVHGPVASGDVGDDDAALIAPVAQWITIGGRVRRGGAPPS